MTSSTTSTPGTVTPSAASWPLQDAKARFSELVRHARSEGPQHVTLHGRDAVVVVDADAYRRLTGARTGQLLVEALQASPHQDIDIEPPRGIEMPVRDVEL
ncbi:type II toxin-antitoxin system prevent-host-death family antitoxin [Sphaerotilus sp.]|uniref:type II toxin-antitoxin system prevent-host-death family antitoxin n=1 Tax=Sphaerotilus sp. TaxID=2093942 RepID=UPI00286E0074|nr:type II toxin-antitoxin system prevent-host-death family antitoxin [Sphaerotilus sp.]